MIYAAASWDLRNASRPGAELITELADAGFTGVSFDPVRQRLPASAAGRAALARAVDRHGFAVTLHSQEPVDPRVIMAYHRLFGERLVNATTNAVLWHDSRGMLIDAERLCANLRALLAASKGARFTVGVEDFPRDRLALDFFRPPLARLLRSSRFGTLVDLGHMHYWLHSRPCYRGMSPRQYVAGVPVRITEVHVHDNDGTGDAHLPLGEGTMHVAAVARALVAAGFDGVCTVEVVTGRGRMAPDVAQMAETMRRLRGAMEAAGVGPRHGAARVCATATLASG